MTSLRNATDLEKTLYRFLLSIMLGFFIGCRMFPTLPPIAYHVLPPSWCPSGLSSLSSMHEQRKNFQVQMSDIPLGSIYIGMMSMENKIDTRTKAAFETWAKRHPKILVEVFANNNGTTEKKKRYASTTLKNGARIIQLPGVKDGDYPPQKKSFSMMKFMHDAYLHNFDWFVRLDDDAYVDQERLLKLLSRINSSLTLYIGSPGFGKDEDDRISTGENYCMGGPGVILSRTLLQKLGPKLGECLQSLYTTHEDIELGRCINRMTGAKCAMAWETRKLFYQNYQHGSYARNIEKIDSAQLDNGIIFHANKQPEYQRLFHVQMLKRKITSLMKRVANLENDIRMLQDVRRDKRGMNLQGEHRWNAMVGRSLFKADEKDLVHLIPDGLKKTLVDGTNAGIKLIYSSRKMVHKKMTAASLSQSYHVVNPLHSVDILSHVQCTYIQKPSNDQGSPAVEYEAPETVYARQYFMQGFAFMEEPTRFNLEKAVGHKLEGRQRSSPNNDQTTPVNFLIALSGRSENFFRFLRNFESSFLARGERVNLFISYFTKSNAQKPNSDDQQDWIEDADSDLNVENINNKIGGYANWASDQRSIVKNLNALEQAYPKSKFKLMRLDVEFSRGLGLQQAADAVTHKDEILFFCDIDLVLAPEILLHIRRNSVQGTQVYYPVFFSQYDPDVVFVERTKPSNHFRFSELDGFWRHFSYGMVSLFKSDFDRTEGFDLSIRGWGLEDVYLVNSILSAGLQIFKSTDPAEVHVFHDKFCDPSLTAKQYKDCSRSRATHYGPRTLLYYLLNAPETALSES